MSSVQILSNLNYPISKVINEGLRNSLDTHIAVAFLKYGGVEIIQDALINSLEKGAEFEIIVGLDFKTTDSKSIRFFLDLNKTYKKLKFFTATATKKITKQILYSTLKFICLTMEKKKLPL